MVKVTTESGSVYLLDRAGSRVRRVSEHTMRRDDEWLSGHAEYEPTVGQRMYLILEPLGDGDVTIRSTTPVVSVEPWE